MSDAPRFWFERRGAVAYALSPFAFAYGRIAGHRMGSTPRGSVPVPVLCVGNFVVGGAGKTPVALEVARVAAAMGRRPGFLSRGYGGTAPMPAMVDLSHHTSRDVGDEPLMLAERHPTAVSPDRVAGARLLVGEGVDFIVMDDGFQNPALAKDFSIAVIGARRGIGNALPIPAGPLRADLRAQLARTDAVAVIGQDGVTDHPSAKECLRRAARRALPILRGKVEPLEAERLEGRSVLAFAGIGDPDKFFATVERTGADLADRQAFDDHHVYDDDAIDDLLARARERDLALVTTEKDAARLKGRGGKAEELLAAAHVFGVQLRFEDERHLRRLIDTTITRARTRRIATA